MSLNKTSFIKLAIKNNVLQFGNFVTKAGRESPYFFNLGSFDNGDSIKSLGQFYANRILETKTKAKSEGYCQIVAYIGGQS